MNQLKQYLADFAYAADGWIPTGGRRPEGLADGTMVFVRDAAIELDIRGERPVEATYWPAWTHYCLAQPAAQEPKCPHGFNDNKARCLYCIDARTPGGFIGHLKGNRPGMQQSTEPVWHPTSQLPEEGRVVELYGCIGTFKLLLGEWWISASRGGSWAQVEPKYDYPSRCEWRYPMAGPSEAAEVHCSGSSDAQGNTRSVLGAGNPVSEQERRQGKPEDVVGNVTAHCNEPHPYRSRNGYGLRIREADVREREPLLISYDVFRRMK